MKIKKTTLYFVLVLILVFGAGAVFLKGGNSSPPSTNSPVGDGEVQEIVLSIKNYNYYPNTITVKADQPVSISLDSSVQGCFRSLVIKDLGVSKSARTPQDTIDFTPTKKGTFTFTCSMGMGYGKIIVE